MSGMWGVWNVECLGRGMFGIRHVWDVECLKYGMFGMWDVWDVRYSDPECEMPGM